MPNNQDVEMDVILSQEISSDNNIPRAVSNDDDPSDLAANEQVDHHVNLPVANNVMEPVAPPQAAAAVPPPVDAAANPEAMDIDDLLGLNNIDPNDPNMMADVYEQDEDRQLAQLVGFGRGVRLLPHNPSFQRFYSNQSKPNSFFRVNVVITNPQSGERISFVKNAPYESDEYFYVALRYAAKHGDLDEGSLDLSYLVDNEHIDRGISIGFTSRDIAVIEHRSGTRQVTHVLHLRTGAHSASIVDFCNDHGYNLDSIRSMYILKLRVEAGRLGLLFWESLNHPSFLVYKDGNNVIRNIMVRGVDQESRGTVGGDDFLTNINEALVEHKYVQTEKLRELVNESIAFFNEKKTVFHRNWQEGEGSIHMTRSKFSEFTNGHRNVFYYQSKSLIKMFHRRFGTRDTEAEENNNNEDAADAAAVREDDADNNNEYDLPPNLAALLFCVTQRQSIGDVPSVNGFENLLSNCVVVEKGKNTVELAFIQQLEGNNEDRCTALGKNTIIIARMQSLRDKKFRHFFDIQDAGDHDYIICRYVGVKKMEDGQVVVLSGSDDGKEEWYVGANTVHNNLFVMNSPGPAPLFYDESQELEQLEALLQIRLLEEENSRMEVEEDDSDNIVEEPVGGPAVEELPLPAIAHMVDDEQEVVPV